MWKLMIATAAISAMLAAVSTATVPAQQPNDATAQVPAVKPLAQAHAHNDYYHPRPLFDALDQGFTSIEADVFLVQGQLLVAHSALEVSADKSLESMYLQPLQERVKQNNGRVYAGGPAVILLVDIKRDGAAAYAVLHELLARYADMLSVTQDGVFTEKAVTVVISGDRAVREITASNPRYAGIDGRISDLDSQKPSSLMPLISDNWGLHFQYRGTGTMNDRDRLKLRQIVEKAHEHQRRVRFWATPESPLLWNELHTAGVDLIGTDQLATLSGFLRK